MKKLEVVFITVLTIFLQFYSIDSFSQILKPKRIKNPRSKFKKLGNYKKFGSSNSRIKTDSEKNDKTGSYSQFGKIQSKGRKTYLRDKEVERKLKDEVDAGRVDARAASKQYAEKVDELNQAEAAEAEAKKQFDAEAQANTGTQVDRQPSQTQSVGHGK